jgi:hypothetical protein
MSHDMRSSAITRLRDQLNVWNVTRRCLGVAAMIGGLFACRAMTVTLPDGAVPFSPPRVYAHWWAMTEQCSGITAPMAAVSWYQVPDVTRFSLGDKDVQGWWAGPGNTIVLAGAAALDGEVVRHEMLHALLHGGGHERGYFLERCAGVVPCPAPCVADAGPARLPPATLVTADSLEITVAVDPVRPTASIDDGYFTVTVTARNNATHAVMLDAATPPYGAPANTFGYLLQGPAGGIGDTRQLIDSSAVYFRPLESKKQLFDFSIGADPPARKLPAGSYTLRGSYSDHSVFLYPLLIGP